MTDQIFVTGLALHAYHGVMPHEGKVGQTFTLDLALDIDLTDASRSDKLADTVAYDQVVGRRQQGVLRQALPADRGRRRRGRRRGAGRVSPRHRGARHHPQAARADRRHLRRRRRLDPAQAQRGMTWLRR